MNKNLKIALIPVISIISAIIFLKIIFTIYSTILMNKSVIPENIKFMDDKNYKTEIPRLKKEIQINPSNTKLKEELATAYWATGDTKNAIKTTETYPNKKLAAYNKAMIYYSQKDYKNTIKTIDKYFIDGIPKNCDKNCQYGYKMSQALKTNSHLALNNYQEWFKEEIKLFWIILIYGNI